MSATGPLLMGEEPLATGISTVRQKMRAPTEAEVEAAIRQRLGLSGVVIQKNPNEARSAAMGKGSRIAGTILGFPDLTLIGPEGRVAFVELKRPGVKVNNAKKRAHEARQAEVRASLARLGHVTGRVTSQDEVVALLRAAGWRIL